MCCKFPSQGWGNTDVLYSPQSLMKTIHPMLERIRGSWPLQCVAFSIVSPERSEEREKKMNVLYQEYKAWLNLLYPAEGLAFHLLLLHPFVTADGAHQLLYSCPAPIYYSICWASCNNVTMSLWMIWAFFIALQYWFPFSVAVNLYATHYDGNI